MLAINVGLALATYWVIERKVDSTIPTLSYAPLKKTGDTEYFTRQSLPQDERLAKAVDALVANPSALSSSRPFVYINAATSTGQYSYFLCDRAITDSSANCGAYVIESTEVL